MSKISPQGEVSLAAIRPPKRPRINDVRDARAYGSPDSGLFARFGRARQAFQWANREHFARSLHDQRLHDEGKIPFIGHLWLAKVGRGGAVTDYGLVSCRVVTTAGVGYIVDAFQNLVELENMRYHGVGTGTTAEAASQTALVTELTTQYSTANTRPTGTIGEQAGNSNVFETTATITVSAAVALTEHGLFNQASNAGGVLLDRSVFAAVNLASGDSLLATYDLTFPSGG